MKRLFPPRTSRLRRSGMALVICLSLIVLLTAAVVAFFAMATANRNVEASRASSAKAEQVALSGRDYVISRFLTEIVSNSTVTTSNNIPIYLPKEPAYAIPQRGIAAGISAPDDNYLNLIRQSIPSVDSNASSISTAVTSKNGRLVSANRWNAPSLLGGSGFSNEETLPNWISIDSDGKLNPTDSSATIGRFAYNAYNIGGLLDANVAGFSSPTVSGTNLSILKGTIAGADLTRLGVSQSDVNALVGYRNANASDSTRYTRDTTLAAQDGFIRRIGTKDGGYTLNLFSSRHDLIKYVEVKNPGLKEALPYLTTFSRSLSAPSYFPPTVDNTNPNLANVRVVKQFVRNDGSTARVGEPLLKSRFPLSRLALISRTATASKNATAEIYKYFGLYRSNDSSAWIYDHGDPIRILTLSEVASLPTPREPDFFELLQAGILSGSLGKTIADGYSRIDSYNANKYYQIIQIAANLIDQYDQDSYPTRISFDPVSYPYEFYGVENLPYLTRVFQTLYRIQGTDEFRFWFQPEIWNPHAQAGDISSEGPTRFRYKPTGSARVVFSVSGPSPGVYANVGNLSQSTGISFETRQGVQTFSEPTVLAPTLPVPPITTGTDDLVNNGGHNFMGIFICKIDVPAAKYSGGIPTQYDVSPSPNTEIDHILEYWDDLAGAYLPYNRIGRIYSGNAIYVANLQDNPEPRFFLIRSDPRVNRFGIAMDINNPQKNVTLRPDAGPGAPVGGYMGLKADNHPGDSSSYADPDNVVRPADGAFNSGQFPAGFPLATGNLSSRPLILNRPFRQVAEMGYASRDIPWKHLDFFDKSSGDAALLDLFCIEEVPESAISGGYVDLNTPHVKVLEAILAGAVKSETDGSLMNAEVPSLATSLRALTTGEQGPLSNVSELVSRWIGVPSNSIAANSADTVIKRRREAAVRALGSVCNSRTWNLLIDVVAQSGRYLPGGQFQVEGERRYWCQIAIDRYTGEIIAQSAEPVYE